MLMSMKVFVCWTFFDRGVMSGYRALISEHEAVPQNEVRIAARVFLQVLMCISIKAGLAYRAIMFRAFISEYKALISVHLKSLCVAATCVISIIHVNICVTAICMT